MLYNKLYLQYVKCDVYFDAPTLAAMHPAVVVVKPRAVMAFRESRMASPAALLAAENAEDRAAAADPVER